MIDKVRAYRRSIGLNEFGDRPSVKMGKFDQFSSPGSAVSVFYRRYGRARYVKLIRGMLLRETPCSTRVR